MKKKNLRFLKIFISLVIVLLFIGLIFVVMKKTELWDKINSIEKFRLYILSLGVWGRVAFVFFQFLQVTFLPIPSPIFIIAGSIIYGVFQSTILSLAGIILGSAFAFFLGKTFGKSIVIFLIGKETYAKWKNFLNNCKYTFVLMMILPFFPDDILCLVAGLTNMSWTFFMMTQFLTRPISIFLVSYFSNGEIIPYHGWGIPVWGVIIVVSMLLLYLSKKYNYVIERKIQNITKKNNKN